MFKFEQLLICKLTKVRLILSNKRAVFFQRFQGNCKMLTLIIGAPSDSYNYLLRV